MGLSGIKVLGDRVADLALIKSSIVSIKDYPQPGIMFRDITTLCADPRAFALSVELLAACFAALRVDTVLCAEARGFVFGAPVAVKLGAGLVLARKPGKLPRETLEESYALEYGINRLQIHRDSLRPGQRVILIDDLLATGGTMCALIKLARQARAEVLGAGFVIGLDGLHGDEKIRALGTECCCLVNFPDK